MMTKMMQRWEMNEGGRHALALREVAVPQPGPGEVLVKVGAVSLNYRDKMVLEGTLPVPLTFPFTPGSDIAGRVEALGSGVTRFHPGDRVISTFAPGWLDGPAMGDAQTLPYHTLGGTEPGGLADYVAFPADWFVAAPATLDDAEASTLPCAGLTAWTALVERGRVHAGETVLIEGTGGVALFGLQIAKAHGAQVVVVSGSQAKLERAKALGADHGLDRDGWVEALWQLTRQHGADHVLEIVGGAHLAKAAQAAAIGGQIHVIGVLEGFQVSTAVSPLLLKNLSINGISVGHRRALEDFVRAVDGLGLKPVIDARYELAALLEALDHLDRGPFGKVVVEMR